MKTTFVSALLILMCCLKNMAQIGTWKVYPSYEHITDVQQAGSTIYTLASGGLFAYHKSDNSVQTLDRTTGLNDTEITHIGYNRAARRLVIVYKNYNIDLLDDNGNVTNLSDYCTKSLTDDKTIHSIFMDGIYAYLATGFGIMKVNVRDAEISDTYFLGFQVDWIHQQQDQLIAESSAKGKYAAKLSSNLSDRKNWNRIGNYTKNTNQKDEALMKKMEKYRPIGPKYNHFYHMIYANNQLYTTAGVFISGNTDLNHPGTVQVFNEQRWQIYQDSLEKITGYSYVDNNCVAVDPHDKDHVFAGGRTGLYEFLHGKLIKYYNKNNSILGAAIDRGRELSNNYVLINGMTFDKNSHLWILNSQTKRETIIELTPDGKMISHFQKDLIDQMSKVSCMTSAMFDSRGLLWFGNAHSGFPGLFCYCPITNKLHTITKLVNQDGINLDVLSVKCIVEDLENNIWIGTNIGPLMLPASQIPTLENVVFNQIKIDRKDGSNLADYLLSGVDITCIAVDQSNRKWFGTENNGVYLMSADANEQIHHFTTNNSVLPSNNIQSIAINDKTGEVFFGSDKGLCSYYSDATKAAENMNKETTYAYPNPIEPGYTGPITIVGLSYQADIKIVTVNGVLVAQGRSNGGTFVWNGTDMNGNPVASGMYMVQTATQEGKLGTVCKIAIIR